MPWCAVPTREAGSGCDDLEEYNYAKEVRMAWQMAEHLPDNAAMAADPCEFDCRSFAETRSTRAGPHIAACGLGNF